MPIVSKSMCQLDPVREARPSDPRFACAKPPQFCSPVHQGARDRPRGMTDTVGPLGHCERGGGLSAERSNGANKAPNNVANSRAPNETLKEIPIQVSRKVTRGMAKDTKSGTPGRAARAIMIEDMFAARRLALTVFCRLTIDLRGMRRGAE
jgi:hypothetical protein